MYLFTEQFPGLGGGGTGVLDFSWGGGQRRSQVSLVGGVPTEFQGGINLNTYTYKMSRRAA